jgi:superfamily II DNA helicase RecQ
MEQVRDLFKIDVIISTVSLSMGLDCSKLNGVLHYNLPSSVESYVQQIGRSGRSGQNSTCITFLKRNDFYFSRNKVLIEYYQPQNILDGVVDLICLDKYCFENQMKLNKKGMLIFYFG